MKDLLIAIDIKQKVPSKSDSVSYMGLTDDQFNFLKGLEQDKEIIGFEWAGKGEFGIILVNKKK